MTQRNYRRGYSFQNSFVSLEEFSLSSGNSPKGPGGKGLQLRTNGLQEHYSKCLGYISNVPGDQYKGSAQQSMLNDFPTAEYLAHQQAYARVRGQLYKGNAALGVTFASMKQSRDMIASRSRLIESAAAELTTLSSKVKMTKKMADNHLEVIFGWQPLLGDIHAAATSVIQRADAVEFVRASGTQILDVTQRGRWDQQYQELVSRRGTYRVSLGGQVRISNPNLWLAERAGLCNPVAVAWDIVPFSFIANMFSNVGALVNQISDFYGLTFDQTFHARRCEVTKVVDTKRVWWKDGWVQVTYNRDKDRRTGLSAPPVRLSFRTPELDWGTAAMAASLMVQQAVPAINMLSRFHRIGWKNLRETN